MAGALTISTLNDDTGVLATQNGMTGIAKAWVNFNGTGTVAIRDSFNVSSITDNGTGNYTVNLTTAMPNSNYSVIASANNGLDGSGINTSVATYPISSSSASVKTIAATAGTAFDAVWVSASVFSS
jgi:hypothetical protein